VLVAGDPGRELCKLADFGLARVYHASPLSGLTMLGDTGGTVAFMPPEQVTDYRNVRPVSDVYSTAAMLYFLLTKQHVFDFQRSPKAHWLSKILTEAPIPIRERRTDIPDSLANAIQRALAKDVAKRFTAASEFRRELTPFAGQT